MSQLRLGYPKFRAADTEVVVVTATPPSRASQYQELFHFELPYLCDPERETARRYRLPSLKKDVIGGAVSSGAFWKGLVTLPTDMRTYPEVKELQALGAGQVDGFFVIDKAGVVRSGKVGGGLSMLPRNEEIEQILQETNAA